MQEKSPNNAEQPRNLVEEDCYRERLQDLKLHHQTLDGIFEELAPAVCRCPDIYPGEDGIHRILVLAGVDHPALRIWFTFDSERVYLIDIERIEGGR